MAHVVIVGAGPAGVSAALYTARAGISTTVVAKGSGALEKTDKIENYYGFAHPVSGKELEAAGIQGAKNAGVRFVQDEVVGIDGFDGFSVRGTVDTYKADSVILATGAPRAVPALPGIAAFEGSGVSYCAVCDAFFYRGKDVVVLGDGQYAVHEVSDLLPVVKSVSLVTDGKMPTAEFPAGVAIYPERVKEIYGTDRVEGVAFANGETLAAEGVFVAYGVAGSVELARKMGAVVKGNRIAVDAAMATTIPGLFAAGDCTGGLLQIAKAVYEGAVAGLSAVQFLRAKKKDAGNPA